MSNAVLDRPVAPSDWVHETHTAGADARSTVEVRSVDRSGYELFLQSLSHLTGSSHTGSIHVVAEQIYVAQPRVILITLRGNLDHVRDRLLAAITGTVATFAEPPLPAIDDQGSSSHSRALRAADDLKIWLDLTYDDIAAMSGLAKRTIHHWRATGAQPRPATVRRLLEIHALVQAMRRKLGPERFDEWIRTGTPSPLQLLQAGEWDAAQQAAYGILFSRRRRERDFDGYSPYDPETDFSVGAPDGREFRRATRSPRRGRLPRP